MMEVFDDQGRESLQARRDTELTLGSGTLLAILLGLVLVCGLCFGLGYAVGHHGSRQPATAGLEPPSGDQAPLQASGAPSKPSAVTQPAAPRNAEADQPPSADSGAEPESDAQTSNPGVSAGASSSQVRPALASAASSPQPAPNAHAFSAPGASLMVQIASVANSEDAEVLVNALRRRGYAVTARREPADSLIHVRIGPFKNRAEADRWRQKLLGDGYNAIVMQ
jgi:cell division septation protein DedD